MPEGYGEDVAEKIGHEIGSISRTQGDEYDADGHAGRPEYADKTVLLDSFPAGKPENAYPRQQGCDGGSRHGIESHIMGQAQTSERSMGYASAYEYHSPAYDIGADKAATYPDDEGGD